MFRKKRRISYKHLIDQHLKILKSLQYESGLFAASTKNVSTGYDKSWLRDNFYECLAFEILGDWETVEKTYNALLTAFIKHEYKIDHAIAHKPKYKHEYIHARVHPENFDEFWEDWGNKQNDAVGAILFMIGKLEEHKRRSILNTEEKIRIVNKLVRYLASLRYWEDFDNGVWEENEEIHASSVGACLAGLKSVKKLGEIHVPHYLIDKGEQMLSHLLPRESEKKYVDLAQLSLIYPYNVVNAENRKLILENVEYHLVRQKGVIRYKNDYYYNRNPDGYSEEAEWTMGFAWLAIIYDKMGNLTKAKFFIDKLISIDTKYGLPELYFSNSSDYNENTPLGWAESLFIVAMHEFNKKHHKTGWFSNSSLFSKIKSNTIKK